MRTYSSEFPNRPPIEFEIPEGFVDESWNQDVCPKFYNEELGVVLWVEEPDASKREFPEMGRFCLVRVTPLEDGDFEFSNPPDVICESESFDDVLAALAKLKS